MSSDQHNGYLGPVLVGGALTLAGVIAGMALIPPFFANRSVELSMRAVVQQVQPTDSDAAILSKLNAQLATNKVTRFYIEDGEQRTGLDFQLNENELKVTRDGNRSLQLDVIYTQQTLIPLLKRPYLQTFHAHAE